MQTKMFIMMLISTKYEKLTLLNAYIVTGIDKSYQFESQFDDNYLKRNKIKSSIEIELPTEGINAAIHIPAVNKTASDAPLVARLLCVLSILAAPIKPMIPINMKNIMAIPMATTAITHSQAN
jgi:hypothetical protein